MTKYITYLSKTEEVMEIKPLNHGLFTSVPELKDTCFYLWGWSKSDLFCKCTKPFLKLKNDQSENNKSVGWSKVKRNDCRNLETKKKKRKMERKAGNEIVVCYLGLSRLLILTYLLKSKAWFSYVRKIPDDRGFFCFPTVPDFVY